MQRRAEDTAYARSLVAQQSNPRRARLGTWLRELRAARYRSASALGRDLGWQQSRVSKLERGAQLPTPEDLDAWATATGANPAVRAELADLLTAARVEYSVWSDVYRTGGIAERQAELGRLEAQAAVIREYQPAMIPGLVQTPASKTRSRSRHTSGRSTCSVTRRPPARTRRR